MAGYALFFLMFYSNLAAGAVVYHITPNSSDPCTMPCSNLTLFSANFSSFLSFQNTTVILLPGKHYLSTQLQVFHQNHFLMASLNTTAQVVCEDTSLISFNNTQVVHIMNIEFIACGHNQFQKVNELVLVNTKFVGTISSGTALELSETNAQITSSAFFSNANGTLLKLTDQLKLIKKILGVQGTEFNTNGTWVGGAIAAIHSNIGIESSMFENNSAEIGGALFMESCSLDVVNTTFISNYVHNQLQPQLIGIAGALYLIDSHTTLANSDFNGNFASVGGVAFILRGTLDMHGSNFTMNTATYGGALFLAFPDVIALRCQLDNNKAEYGGVLRSFTSNVVITDCQFIANNATFGGVILSFNSSMTMKWTAFTNNKADIAGAVLVAAATTIIFQGSLLLTENSADEFGVMYLSECSGSFQGNATFSNNFGTLLAIYSNITFSGLIAFTTNLQLHTIVASVNFQDGGALSLFQSYVVFDGECLFESNHAENGGAVHSIESNIFVDGRMTLVHNQALRNGGGIYLSQSELSCGQQGILNITSNAAINRGGGIYAIGSIVRSTTIDKSNLMFLNNSAEAGGALYLGTNAKLYIHKVTDVTGGDQAVHFINNMAEYGGAVYVDDHTNTATCTVKSMECFFRVVYNSYIIVAPNIATISFQQNYASLTGSNLFGGLLDRCIVSPFARLNIYAVNAYRHRVNGVTYFRNVSTEINSSSVSSYPTRVCQCMNNHPNCSYHLRESVKVKKGQTFSVSLVAVDQIGQPVDATIQSILRYNGSGLAEGQLTRSIPGECTALKFSIVSPQDHEVLSLYASNGPCNNADLSTLSLEIGFLTCNCPIGFEPSKINAETNCTCECHESISRYMICDPLTESLMRESRSIAWIAYINDTNANGLTGYLVFPNCPYDYCNPLSVPIQLTQVNGADKQCAFNRSGLLCGSCQSGLSLSLGSSRCLQCNMYWPAAFVFITIAALLAGILLVIVLWALNIAVAVGTLNGLIFYVNIVAANRSILMPFEEQNFVTVFISWLNLELGIDTCYFPGMDAYSKTWIQLSFVAAYVIFLIAFIMVVISSYSSKFTNFIGKRNPVATLSTLVFFSYAKLLEIVFTALSFSVVQYPNGSNRHVWLPDATVTYLQGKHIVLFIAATNLLVLGLVYTFLLFSWQWLLRLPSWRIFNWTRNQKLHTFIETYHAPYISKHRYWTGMLLLIRAILYLIAAVNISNDPRVTLVSITFTLGFLLLLKGFIGRLYRNWPLDILETFFYFNLLALSLFAWYFIDRKDHYRPVAYSSIIVTFILLVAIFIYHLHTYTALSSKVVKFEQRVKAILGPKPKHQTPPPDDFLDMVDRPISTNYKQVFEEEPEGHTTSVLDICDLEIPTTTGQSTTSTIKSQQTIDTNLSTATDD